MEVSATSDEGRPKPLRLWPGVVILLVQWFARFILPEFAPDTQLYGILVGVFGGGLAILIWWAFFSRVPRTERWGGLALLIAAVLATPLILHESIAQGAMGILFIMLVLPFLSLALVGWAVASPFLAAGLRRPALAAVILLACGGWALLKTGGFSGDGDNDFSWRWSPTPEERLLARAASESLAAPGTTAQGRAEWPGFLGPQRNGAVTGVQIATDWAATPPLELWRRPVGPGWSSFAVQGDLFYTQEQRGDDEIVACYKMATGEPVWRHRDAARFWESNGGAGPRSTPSLSDGTVYSFGGTGILNALDAGDGTVLWSRDTTADTDAAVPQWGFSSSPLVTDELVVVAVSGALIAYDRTTGEPRWHGSKGGESYSSPRLLTIDGVAQILSLSGSGLSSVDPSNGALLWEHAWGGFPIVQPGQTADGDILISVSQDGGLRRLTASQRADGWSVEERWTTRGLKPYYSEFAVHEGHAFGFDGSILACVDLADGKRRWKGGRYGAGQLFLLADQDLLLVLGEKGELALVRATPDRFTELARFAAVEGKTWNHPVLVGDVLLVRNAEEMVAFRLSLAGS